MKTLKHSPFAARLDFNPPGDASEDEAKAAAEKAAADKAAADKAAADKVAADKAAKEAADKKTPTDAEAALLKEVMEKKAKLKETEDRLKAFEGLDPAQIKALVAAQKKADEDKVAAERAAEEAKGNFARVKEMMVEDHNKAMAAKDAELAAAKAANETFASQISNLTIGAAFAGSKFIADELVLTPAKARQVYEGHFDIEDGKVVAYDKPRGAKNRTPLVDARGDGLGFEVALKKIVEADPDRDHMLRAKIATGTGSNTQDGKRKAEDKVAAGTGQARFLTLLNAGKK